MGCARQLLEETLGGDAVGSSGAPLKLLLCLHLNSSTSRVYVLKVVTADAMQQVKETQAVLGTNIQKKLECKTLTSLRA